MSQYEVKQVLEKYEEKNIENIGLKSRILQLEKTVKQLSFVMFKEKTKLKKKDLDVYRNEIAEKLGVKSLDEYIIDDETLILHHEKDLEGKV